MQPINRVMFRRCAARIVQLARQRFIQRVDEQGRFAAARHAGDASECAQRNFRRYVFQIIAARALNRNALAGIGFASLLRHRHFKRARQILAGQAFLGGDDFLRCAFGNHFAAMNTGTGANIDNMVGGHNGFLIMLNHDNRIAEVAQARQRIQQARIIALMQTNTRLVENVKNAGKARADLRGETNTLAFTAG